MLLKYIVLLAVGIVLLIKGSDFFVDAGSGIGKTLKINEMLLGVTIVSFGTSLPEFIVALTSAQSGSNEIALGNILGTNLFNTCVILAVIALFNPVKFKKDTVKKLKNEIHVSLSRSQCAGQMSDELLRADCFVQVKWFISVLKVTSRPEKKSLRYCMGFDKIDLSLSRIGGVWSGRQEDYEKADVVFLLLRDCADGGRMQREERYRI